MKTQLIKDILVSEPDGRLVTICGWVRTKRDSKNLCFIQVNDGSCFATIQLTYDRENANNENIEKLCKDLKRLKPQKKQYRMKHLMLSAMLLISRLQRPKAILSPVMKRMIALSTCERPSHVC